MSATPIRRRFSRPDSTPVASEATTPTAPTPAAPVASASATPTPTPQPAPNPSRPDRSATPPWVEKIYERTFKSRKFACRFSGKAFGPDETVEEGRRRHAALWTFPVRFLRDPDNGRWVSEVRYAGEGGMPYLDGAPVPVFSEAEYDKARTAAEASAFGRFLRWRLAQARLEGATEDQVAELKIELEAARKAKTLDGDDREIIATLGGLTPLKSVLVLLIKCKEGQVRRERDERTAAEEVDVARVLAELGLEFEATPRGRSVSFGPKEKREETGTVAERLEERVINGPAAPSDSPKPPRPQKARAELEAQAEERRRAAEAAKAHKAVARRIRDLQQGGAEYALTDSLRPADGVKTGFPAKALDGGGFAYRVNFGGALRWQECTEGDLTPLEGMDPDALATALLARWNAEEAVTAIPTPTPAAETPAADPITPTTETSATVSDDSDTTAEPEEALATSTAATAPAGGDPTPAAEA